MMITNADLVVTAIKLFAKEMILAVQGMVGVGEAMLGLVTKNFGQVTEGASKAIGAFGKMGSTAQSELSGLASRIGADALANVENFKGKYANAFASAVQDAGKFLDGVKTVAAGVMQHMQDVTSDNKPGGTGHTAKKVK